MIDQEQVPRGQLLQVEPEGSHVLRQLFGGFLKGDEDPRLSQLGCSAHEELDREEGLSAPRASADQCGATAG